MDASGFVRPFVLMGVSSGGGRLQANIFSANLFKRQNRKWQVQDCLGPCERLGKGARSFSFLSCFLLFIYVCI